MGEQGDACAEYAALSEEHTLVASSTSTPADMPVSLTANGYRVGETVTFTDNGTPIGTVLAGPDGSAMLTTTPDGLGSHSYHASGAGSKRVSSVQVTVLRPTSTSLSMSPAMPEVKEPVTLTASVSGVPSWATVVFLDGTTELGSALVADGVATLQVPGGFGIGEHAVTAVLQATGSSTSSTSGVIAFTFEKAVSTTVLELSSASTTYGSGATGAVTVEGADGGTVTVTYAGTSVDVPLTADGAGSFAIPASLAVGSYEVTASYSGTETVAPSTSAVTAYEVTKAGTSTKVTAKGSVRKGGQLAVTVAVSGTSGAAAPTGTVVVTLAGVTKTVTLTDGVGSTSIKAAKAGKRKLSVAYSGDESYAGSADSKTVTVLPKK